MKKLLFIAVLCACTFLSFAQTIPLKKGSTWTYSITVEYMKNNKAATKTFTSKMKITDYISRKDGYEAALVTGYPGQYAFYEEGVQYDGKIAIIKTPAMKYYFITLDSSLLFTQLLKKNMGKLLAEETPFFKTNVQKAEVLCGKNEATCEAKFHWACVNVTEAAGKASKYEMNNFDNTGSETWDILADNGFENYSYNHNGTLATVKAVLQKFSRK